MKKSLNEFRAKQNQRVEHHKRILDLYSRSKACPSCGVQMDLNMCYSQRPHLVGDGPEKQLICGACCRHNGHQPHAVGSSWYPE